MKATLAHPPALVSWDVSSDIRKRIRLTSSQIGGKCLIYQVQAAHIPAGQTRDFTVCDDDQSGSRVGH